MTDLTTKAGTTCNGCKKKILNLYYMECMSCKGLYDLDCINVTKSVYESFTQEEKDIWSCPECIRSTCKGCKKKILDLNFMECVICKGWYDLDCINISQLVFESFTQEGKDIWSCPECISSRPKSGNIHTPVRTSLGGWNTTFVTEIDTTIEEDQHSKVNMDRRGPKTAPPSDPYSADLLTEIRNELLALKVQTAEILPLRKDLQRLTESIGIMSQEMSILKQVLIDKDKKILELELEKTSKNSNHPSTSSYAAKASSGTKGQASEHKQRPKESLATRKPNSSFAIPTFASVTKSSNDVSYIGSVSVAATAAPVAAPAAGRQQPRVTTDTVEFTTEVESDKDWNLVQNSRKKRSTYTEIRHGGNKEITLIKGMEKKKYMHVWRLKKGTTEKELSEYVESLGIKKEEMKVEKIKTRTERDYASFMIGVLESDYDKLNNYDVWPVYVEFSEWTWFRQYRKKETTGFK